MTNPFMLTCLVFLLLSCIQPIQISKTALKQIFTSIITDDHATGKYFLIDSILASETTSIRESGIIYSIAGCTAVKDGVWNNEIFDSARIVSRTQLDSISEPDPFMHTPAYYSFSLPYFSKDQNSFVIYYSYYCGNLCAEYSLRLYKKTNGRWKFIKTYSRMVS